MFVMDLKNLLNASSGVWGLVSSASSFLTSYSVTGKNITSRLRSFGFIPIVSLEMSLLTTVIV